MVRIFWFYLAVRPKIYEQLLCFPVAATSFGLNIGIVTYLQAVVTNIHRENRVRVR